MKVHKQEVTVDGNGTLYMDCTVTNNQYHYEDLHLCELQQQIATVEKDLPNSFAKEQRDEILATLKEIEASVSKKMDRGTINHLLEKLKSYIPYAVAATSFASSVTDLITFFQK